MYQEPEIKDAFRDECEEIFYQKGFAAAEVEDYVQTKEFYEKAAAENHAGALCGLGCLS